MAGIFSGHVFEGMGQTTTSSDASFDSLISSLATPRTSTTTPTLPASMLPPSTTSKSGTVGSGKAAASYPDASSAYSLPSTAYVAAPTNNTTIYIVGGVAVVGVLAALFMMSSGRRVAANRRKRSRR